MDGPRPLMTGKVGDHLAGDWLSQEAGYEAARMAALSVLASLSAQLGTLDRVSGWLKVLGFVSVAPGFTGTSFVMNGFSDTILDVARHPGVLSSSCRLRVPATDQSRSLQTVTGSATIRK